MGTREVKWGKEALKVGIQGFRGFWDVNIGFAYFKYVDLILGVCSYSPINVQSVITKEINSTASSASSHPI
jgi:hypothetical protein